MASLFEHIEGNAKMPKPAFNNIAADLRLHMVQMQQSLRKADFPVIVVFAGVDGAGKSESVQLLNEWMDPRWIVTRAYGVPSEEEAERPEFWRYWRDLPAKGQFGLYLSAWYSDPLVDKVYKRIGRKKLDARLEHIKKFEQTLADDGALILKFWMHLNQREQKKRLRKLERDPHQHWRITARDWKNWKRYDRFIETAEYIINHTDSPSAPWQLVDAADPPYRAHTVLTSIEQAVRERIARGTGKKKTRRRVRTKPLESSVLSQLDLSQAVSREAYGQRLREQRARLHALHQRAKEKGLSVMLAFEGWDAAGKGGAIRRLTAALDARDYRVVPIAAPTDEERAHHYLWRFWRHVSRAGRFTIFDRSWYGRLLVEQVEQLIDKAAYERSFDEIVEFEQQISEHGILLLKYWLHIDKDEQAARFEKRKTTPYKSWKLTDEDWRNREKWADYERCVDELVRRTSTDDCPWILVEANDKRFARLKVIETLCDALEKRLG